jgi:hypothetical protein
MVRSLCALAVLLAVAASDVSKAAAIERIPVTAWFRCNAVPSQLTPDPCGTGDRLAGDGGDYRGVQIRSKVLPQNAYITGDGVFWFVHQAESGRSVFFDFSQQVAAPPPPVLRLFTTTWSSALQPNWLGSPTGVTNGLWGLRQADGPVAGKLKVNFRANDSYLWTIRFDAAGHSPSTDLLYACTGEDESGACNQWRIEATSAHLGLLQAATTSGKQVVYNQGTYRMPFAIDISYP